ncbi:porin [Actibacterium sp. 188UL27-1]|uniref:porin n=1 Tax=Actibacterium sp. 188UL27-1 TaxID=2786961 RepID=UPI00195D70DB|nr:porin [Actibacterium sp. 188UL27-1]MBM7067158.1 porin [Actibacterium sp. 188UL27-1]
MKKILLASTAIVGMAGMAAAEVSISGSAEMGIVGGDRHNDTTQFWSDVDVTFDMTGETDGGLQFGVSVDLDEAPDLDADGEKSDADFAVFISGDFGKVTLGDTDGALDFALQDQNIGHPGSIADDETDHFGFFGSFHDGAGAYDGQIMRYEYTFDAFAVAISVEQGGTGNIDIDKDGDGTIAADGSETFAAVDELDAGFALAARYSFDIGAGSVTVGGGFQSIDADANVGGEFFGDALNSPGVGLIDEDGDSDLGETADIFALSVSAALDNGFSAVLTYADGDVLFIEDSNHVSLGVAYTTGALTVAANYGEFDFGNGDSAEGFALNAGYDLGGGLSVLAGYSDSTFTDDSRDEDTDTDSFSLGLSMSF